MNASAPFASALLKFKGCWRKIACLRLALGIKPFAPHPGNASHGVVANLGNGHQWSATLHSHDAANLDLAGHGESPFRSEEISLCDLEMISDKDFYRKPSDPPICVGSKVRLNSGSPSLLVVDIDGLGMATVSAVNSAGNVFEHRFPTVCLHIDHVPKGGV